MGSVWTQLRPGESLPAVRDGLGEEAQVLVDLHAVMDLQDVVLFVFEESQSVPEDHLQHKTTQMSQEQFINL